MEANDGKDLFMQGLFIQGDVKNQNGRVYPKDEIQRAVENVTQRLKVGETVMGELDHPEELQINLDRVSHIITEMHNNIFNISFYFFSKNCSLFSINAYKSFKSLLEWAQIEIIWWFKFFFFLLLLFFDTFSLYFLLSLWSS
jgi:hypothetical protein